MSDPLTKHYVDTYDRGFRRLAMTWEWTKLLFFIGTLIALTSIAPTAVLVLAGTVLVIFGGWALFLFVIHAKRIGEKTRYARATGFEWRYQEVLRLSHEYPCTAAILHWCGRIKDKKNKNEVHDEAKKPCCSGDH